MFTFRMPFTYAAAVNAGFTRSRLAWAVKTKKMQRVGRGVYLHGDNPPTPLELAVATVIACDGVASGSLAGALYELDSVELHPPFVTTPTHMKSKRREVRREDIASELLTVVQGLPSTNGIKTVIDLAAQLSDFVWEQTLESALRKKLFRLNELVALLPKLGSSRTNGTARMRRVLQLRGLTTPPTESLLETLAVQLIRTKASLPTPTRQTEIYNHHDIFVARVDLAWPDIGVFVELDGQHHKDQPVYDARRETAVVAATGWLPARFTWHEITHAPKTTLRRLQEILQQARQLHEAS